MHVVEKEASSAVCPCTTHLRISVSCTKGECTVLVSCTVRGHEALYGDCSELFCFSPHVRVPQRALSRAHFLCKACFMRLIDQGDHAIVTTPVTHPHPSY